MPRVMHVLSSLDTGGVERRVVGQFSALQALDDGLAHGLVALRGGGLAGRARTDLGATGVPLWILDKGRGWDRAADAALRRAMSEFQPDLVTAYNFVAGFWTRLVTRGRWGGTVVHEGGIRQAGTVVSRVVESALSRWTRARIFNSQATRIVWESALGPSPRHHVVLNGVEVASVPRRPSTAPATTLITVGRLVPIKGVDIQIRALARLLADGRNVQLVVVGDGPQRPALEALAREMGVGGRVRWLGYRSDPEVQLAAADIFLCTSYNETFSLSLCEAMVQGLVCIAPRVGGPAEIIRDGLDGLLLPCRQVPPPGLAAKLPTRIADSETGTVRGPLGVHPDDLTLAVASILDGEVDRVALGQAAQERVIRDFSRERYAADLSRCYHAILDGGGQT
ncbi:MAG: glycosyltransferase [Candidatus Krumholzibacteriia bacterium]